MAKVRITFGSAMGGGAPVYGCRPRASEAITSSASNQVTTEAAEIGEVITITALSDVDVSIGLSPDATSDVVDTITAGGVKSYGPASAGFKVAVVDA